MQGYRNVLIAVLAVATSAYLIYAGITYGTDMVSLSTALAAKDAAAMGMIFGRGYNKKVQVENGKK